MIINLLRHGATDANEKGLYCGFTDLPLSGPGKSKLIQIRDTQNYRTADIYITSGMKRANETLDILYGKAPDLIIEDFKEYNFGRFEMKSHDELCGDEEYLHWLECGCETMCPGGESREMFRNRIKAGLDRVAGLNAESCMIVSHGGVIVTIIEILFPELFPNHNDYFQLKPELGNGISFGYSWELNCRYIPGLKEQERCYALPVCSLDTFLPGIYKGRDL